MRGLIGPKIETILSALEDVKKAISMSEPYNLENVEIRNYFFGGHINILESFTKC